MQHVMLVSLPNSPTRCSHVTHYLFTRYRPVPKPLRRTLLALSRALSLCLTPTPLWRWSQMSSAIVLGPLHRFLRLLLSRCLSPRLLLL
jgi:hypothetical protein